MAGIYIAFLNKKIQYEFFFGLMPSISDLQNVDEILKVIQVWTAPYSSLAAEYFFFL